MPDVEVIATAPEIFPLISEMTAKYSENYIVQFGSQLLSGANNAGRGEAAFTFEAGGAQYSALMDNRTCSFCGSLDGLQVNFSKPGGMELYEKYQPAQHPRCRCMWVFIGADEKFKDDNKDFEEKWLEKVKEKEPLLKNYPAGTIVQNIAASNFFSRPELWQDATTNIDFQFDSVFSEVVNRKTDRANLKFSQNALSLFDLDSSDVSIDATGQT